MYALFGIFISHILSTNSVKATEDMTKSLVSVENKIFSDIKDESNVIFLTLHYRGQFNLYKKSF